MNFEHSCQIWMTNRWDNFLDLKFSWWRLWSIQSSGMSFCVTLEVYYLFGGIFRINFLAQRVSQASTALLLWLLLATCWLLGLLLSPEDGGGIFPQSVSKVLPDYTPSYPRRYYSSNKKIASHINACKVILVLHLEQRSLWNWKFYHSVEVNGLCDKETISYGI